MRESGQSTYALYLFIKAIRENRDIAEIRQIIMQMAEVNQAANRGCYKGKTPLWIAAFRGHAALVELLLDRGADVNKAIDNGETPLWIAVRYGHTEIVAQLLAVEGVDVNQSDNDGKTPLWIAAEEGHAGIVTQLLAAGADVTQADRYGTTPLCIAAFRGHAALVELLLDRGAEVTQANDDAKTPLWIAVFSGHAALVELLLDRGADVNKASDNGETPLWIAVRYGHAGIVTQLLAAGADVTQADRYGATPLWIAAEEGHAGIVTQLLAAGADVTQADRYGTTPLCIAVQRYHTAVALLLKLAGARRGDIDFEKNDAVIKQAIKTSDLLQIITQRFPESSMDLHTALDESLDNITDIDTLFKFSIDLKNKFNQIIHPISTANISHMVNQFLPGKLSGKLIGKILNLEILALDKQDLRGAINTGAIVAQIITDCLKESAAQERSFASRVNVSLLIAVYDGDTETVQLLTTKGANVNQTRTIDKATLLWIAAQNGYTATAEILLDRGADVNKATIIGTTPLCIAAQNGHTATVELLLDRGADEKSLTKKQQALYAEEIAKAKQEFRSTIVDTARALALNLHGTPYEEVAQIVPYVIEAKGPDEKLEPNAIYNIALEALAKVAKAELLGKIIGQEKTLLSRYPTSRTKFENLGSFSSRVCDQSAGINCIFMK